MFKWVCVSLLVPFFILQPVFGDLLAFEVLQIYDHYAVYVNGVDFPGKTAEQDIFELTSKYPNILFSLIPTSFMFMSLCIYCDKNKCKHLFFSINCHVIELI